MRFEVGACLGAGRLGIRPGSSSRWAAFAVLCRLDYEFFFVSRKQSDYEVAFSLQKSLRSICHIEFSDTCMKY